MPLPELKVEVPPALDHPAQGPAGEQPARMLALKVLLALPFFLGAAFVVSTLGVGHLMLVLVEIVLIALGCIIALSRNFVVSAIAFVIGGAVFGYSLLFAIMSGVFGGHQ